MNFVRAATKLDTGSYKDVQRDSVTRGALQDPGTCQADWPARQIVASWVGEFIHSFVAHAVPILKDRLLLNPNFRAAMSVSLQGISVTSDPNGE